MTPQRKRNVVKSGVDTQTVPILTGAQRLSYMIGVMAWVAAAVFFWSWWLQPAHIENPVLFGVLSLTMAWTTLFPAYFMVHYSMARRPSKSVDLPPGLRVAMVVTKAPAEPFEVLKKTLNGMLAQAWPHDTWLADENPTEEVRAWCARHGVRISTRFGREDYHRKSWPRRTRCKEGNLAFFYDHYGYENYDVVVQLDADHVPEPGYLEQILLPFADPEVGYVSAPSICDANASRSWSARGRLYAEGNLHGALQAGYTAIGGPLCFGSHYAVRTRALKEIGGLGPELAEDHSTTMMMCAHGWRGAHAIDAIAHGDGPGTFTDLITQEFQWSRSVTTILLRYSPRYLGPIPYPLKLQFIFSQLWYPLFSLFMALSVLLPIAGVVFKSAFATVAFPQFALHVIPLGLVLLVISTQWRSHGTFRPVDAKVVSWEMLAFQFARWPWSFLGCLAAVREHLTDTFVEFRVTPKGASEADPLPLRVLAPYAMLSIASAVPCILVADAADASGLYAFALINAALYAGILVLIVRQHAHENSVRRPSLRHRTAAAMLALVALVTPAAGIMARGLDGLHALEQGGAPFSLTKSTFSPSGAGQGSRRTLHFLPSWNSEN